MEIKIGEAQVRILANISNEDEPRVLLRANWKNTNKTNEVAFKPAEDLKVSDEIKVTVEKISAAPKTDDDKE
ncbi:hypothetical protein ACFLUX_03680 [Chloroflexota bacterium]